MIDHEELEASLGLLDELLAVPMPKATDGEGYLQLLKHIDAVKKAKAARLALETELQTRNRLLDAVRADDQQR